MRDQIGQDDDHDRIERPATLPMVAAMVCLGLGLVLFFEGTVPALRERDQHLATHGQLLRLRDAYDRAIRRAYEVEAALDDDPETILVQIDRLGLTPAELLARTAERAKEAEPR
ncbi:MAG: hypothetical protein IT458_12095 [Planctomycetes bacterium]|nr:hypothetical protein [Planctomycetota bacterium]